MKYFLDKVNIGEQLTAKNGKPYWKVGIQIKGVWYNNILFGDLDKLQEGAECDLILFEEDYNGKMYKKFKFPGKMDALEGRIKNLEIFAKLILERDTILKEEYKRRLDGHKD